MMLQGMTVEMLLRSVWPVAKGDTILIHAAAGGVGLIMCQWAAAMGATVIGTVGSDEKAELARAHGCTHPIVYSKQDFVAEVRPPDRRREAAGGLRLRRSRHIRPIARLPPAARLDGQLWTGIGSGRAILARPAGAEGSLYLTRPTLFNYTATREELDRALASLFDMVRTGKVKSISGSVLRSRLPKRTVRWNPADDRVDDPDCI